MAAIPTGAQPGPQPSSSDDLLREVRELREAVRRLEYANLDLDARIDAHDALEKALRTEAEALIAEGSRLAETLAAFRHRVAERLTGMFGGRGRRLAEAAGPPQDVGGSSPK